MMGVIGFYSHIASATLLAETESIDSHSIYDHDCVIIVRNDKTYDAILCKISFPLRTASQFDLLTKSLIVIIMDALLVIVAGTFNRSAVASTSKVILVVYLKTIPDGLPTSLPCIAHVQAHQC